MGKYTPEVLARGKELNASHSWREVADLLEQEFGKRFDPDALRKKSGSSLKKQPKSFADKVADAKSQLQQSREGAVSKTEIKRQAFSEMLVEMLERVVRPLNFTQPKITHPTGNGTEEEAVLILSDLHFGKKTATYDIAEAKRRFHKVIESVLDINNIHRHAYPIKKLHIIWDGDVVDGEGIYPTQPHHTDDHIVGQVFRAIEAVVEELATLASHFDSVHNYCVRGNHGRISKFAHEDANFDNIFYHTLKVATRGIPKMTWDIPDGWFTILQILNTRFLVVHGHQIKMTLNLPWYGITTRISRWATTNKCGQFDVAVLGHFHTSSRLRWNNKKIFTNGTLVSGDEFALEVLGLESSECQWLLSVHPKRGITWAYEIDCS